jgi:DNA-binding transcriptional ArsR family regulator
MAATEFGDRTAVVRLRQQLSEAVDRAYSLAWAISRLEGKSEGHEAARAARDMLFEALGSPAPETHANVVSFNRMDVSLSDVSRAPEGGASAQEMLLAILKENEATVRELQTALEDCGLSISPGNLSVILSRMNQAGLIQRTGRGMYKYAR